MGFINFLLVFSQKIGYWGIVFLMTIESSFIPFPSELVIPPAAYLASKGEMNIFLVVLFGILGSLIGAIINYYLAMTLGRKIIYTFSKTKWSKIILIDENKIKKAEDYFLKYGKMSTFIGRLVPVIRQLISIPAGFSKMNLSIFLFFTGLGSAIWIIILAFLGYTIGANNELLEKYYHYLKYGILILVFFFACFFFYKKFKKKKTIQDSDHQQNQ